MQVLKLEYLGPSPGRTLLGSCCEKTPVKIKKLYSRSYTKQFYSNLKNLQLCDGNTVLKKSNKYYKQNWNVTETIKFICCLDSPRNDC